MKNSLFLLFVMFALACGAAGCTAESGADDQAQAGDEEDIITGPYQEKVTEQLSRSSQPDTKWIKSLKDRNFGSVVNLRAENNDEARDVQRYGMTAKHIPVVDHQLPSKDQVRDFLDFATRKENQPVLVHCNAGKGRTGIMVAAYRVVVQGWSADDALREGVEKGMSSSKGALLKEIEAEVRSGRFPKFDPVR